MTFNTLLKALIRETLEADSSFEDEFCKLAEQHVKAFAVHFVKTDLPAEEALATFDVSDFNAKYRTILSKYNNSTFNELCRHFLIDKFSKDAFFYFVFSKDYKHKTSEYGFEIINSNDERGVVLKNADSVKKAAMYITTTILGRICNLLHKLNALDEQLDFEDDDDDEEGMNDDNFQKATEMNEIIDIIEEILEERVKHYDKLLDP